MLAVEHLAELGRRRIAHVTGPEHFEAVRLRRDGYRAALAAAGLAAHRRLLPLRSWSEAWGRDAVARLFDGTRRSRPTRCSAATTRSRAASPMRCASAASRCRRDVAIVGFDNWDVMALAARPPLTSIDMNLKALGREAGERLIAMIAGKRVSGVQRLPCSLVVRESVRRLSDTDMEDKRSGNEPV